jgi:hypothetical protein
VPRREPRLLVERLGSRQRPQKRSCTASGAPTRRTSSYSTWSTDLRGHDGARHLRAFEVRAVTVVAQRLADCTAHQPADVAVDAALVGQVLPDQAARAPRFLVGGRLKQGLEGALATGLGAVGEPVPDRELLPAPQSRRAPRHRGARQLPARRRWYSGSSIRSSRSMRSSWAVIRIRVETGVQRRARRRPSFPAPPRGFVQQPPWKAGARWRSPHLASRSSARDPSGLRVATRGARAHLDLTRRSEDSGSHRSPRQRSSP